jgi:FSR family fosmidomycin resistance protein-like MFS transporter
VFAIPGYVGSGLEPLIGILGDTARRRAALIVGGLGFAASAMLSSAALGFTSLLVALVIGNPATGAFVSLGQATLMDLDPDRREQNMARWTLAGSLGYVVGPLVIAAALWVGLGWRAPILALGVCALPLVVWARRLPRGEGAASVRRGLAHTRGALRRRDVIRWLALLEAADLLIDVFHGFLALYFVDVVRVDPRTAAVAVAVWTGAGFVGDAGLVALLRFVDGRTYLRISAAAALAVYPAFLLVGSSSAKLVLVAVLGLLNSGWYAIPKAGLYSSLPGRSGAAIAVGGVGGIVGASAPLALGIVAGAVGLGPTMWILLLAPLALLVASPRRRR